MSREKDGLHTKLYILDGYAHYADQVVFEKLTGDLIIISPYEFDLQEIYIRADCRVVIPALQDKGSCFLIGDVYQGRGAFVLSNEDQSFIIENSSNHAFIFSVDHTKTLVALKKTLVTAEEIKNIAIENSCEIAEKVSIYNHDGRFVGEYDKEKDMITYINEMGGEKEIKEKSNKSWNLMFM